jgi:hypothetical protein
LLGALRIERGKAFEIMIEILPHVRIRFAVAPAGGRLRSLLAGAAGDLFGIGLEFRNAAGEGLELLRFA